MQFFKKLLDASDDLVFVIGDDGGLRHVSGSVTSQLGWAQETTIGQPAHRLIPPSEIAPFNAALQSLGGAGQTATRLELQLLRSDGSRLWVEGQMTNLLHDPDIAGVVVSVRDIDARRAHEQQLLTNAFYDDVTGLASRALFMDRLDQALYLSRHEIIVKALFVMVDRFDDLRRSVGWGGTDLFMREVADRFVDLPADAMVGRYNATSFVIATTGTESNRGELVAAVRRIFAKPFDVAGTPQLVSASIGLSSSTGGQLSSTDLIAQALAAAHEARRSGPGQAVAFSDRLDTRADFREATRAELQRAVDEGELRVHYQPIVDVASQRVAGVEAFVRWDHPERGLVSPAEFITIADETGLIEPIGAWVISTALDDVSSLNRSEKNQLFVTVNLSQRQLAGIDFVRDLRAALSRSGIDPSLLQFDLNEATLGHANNMIGSRLRQLRQLGIGIAIDDFGAGSSSLLGLRDAPATHVKIDRHFTATLSATGSGLVGGVIGLAHALELETIAEGVETQAQFDELRRLGCGLSQGWLHARPMPLADLVAFLGENHAVPQ